MTEQILYSCFVIYNRAINYIDFFFIIFSADTLFKLADSHIFHR